MALPLARRDARTTKEHLLDVAESLFAENGFDGASLADICDQVGLAKSSLLHHFPSKAAIYAAVLERIAGDLDALVEASESVSGGPAARQRALILSLFDWTRGRPDYTRIVLRDLMENTGRAGRVRRWVMKPALDRMAALIAGATGSGENRTVFDPMLFLLHTIGGIAYFFAGLPTIAGIMACDDADELSDRFRAQLLKDVDAVLSNRIAGG